MDTTSTATEPLLSDSELDAIVTARTILRDLKHRTVLDYDGGQLDCRAEHAVSAIFDVLNWINVCGMRAIPDSKLYTYPEPEPTPEPIADDAPANGPFAPRG